MKNQSRDEQQLTGDERELNGQQAMTEETGDTDAVEVEEDQDELDVARAERDRYLEQLQRSVAEFANYRRRSEQERAHVVPMVRRDVLAQFLPVLDDFERAMAQVPEDRRGDTWIVGLVMIESKFRNVLERSDVRAIDPKGEPFDPAMHESVASDPGSSGSTVVEVYQKGYAIGDVLIRPAMVKTGDPKDADEHVPDA